jgi:hypothetical protein
VPTIKTTKMFPDTSDKSQPRSTPATAPVTVNLRMFFIMSAIGILHQLPQAGQVSSHLAQHVVWIRQEDIVVGTP